MYFVGSFFKKVKLYVTKLGSKRFSLQSFFMEYQVYSIKVILSISINNQMKDNRLSSFLNNIIQVNLTPMVQK